MRIILFVLTTFGMALGADGAEWGSLKGRLIFDGTPGDPKPIIVNKDPEFCGQHKLVDETLVVGEKGGLANVFVYLYLKKGKSVDVHPDLQKPSDKPVVLDNKGCRFHPHALLVRTGQPFKITSSDVGIGHNTNAPLLANPQFNQTVPIDKVFEKSESYPSGVACNIHPWMKSFVLIRDNPYMAVSDAKGSFEIKSIPAGTHEFIFWHESSGNMRDLEIGKTKTSRKGRAKLAIPAGEMLDLGEVKVSARVLKL